ncbi:MAG: cytochrome P450 [Acidimicrobiales bacterium]
MVNPNRPVDDTGTEAAPAASDDAVDPDRCAEPDLGTSFLMEAFDPANRSNPYPLYARMRASHPVLDAGNHLWFAFSHGAAQALLRAKQVSSDERRSAAYQRELADGNVPAHVLDREPSMLFLDPPDHDRLRGLVNQAFTQRRVELLASSIEARTADLLDTIDGAGPVDLVEALAYPLPVAVICELMGVPEQDHRQFGAWSRDLTKGLDPSQLRTEDDNLSIAAALDGLEDYIADLLRHRRAVPGDDLLTALLDASDGEDRLSETELISLAVLLLVAGHETTVNLIGNGAVALLHHPDQLARWRSDPSLAKGAVDELLRFDSPVQIGMRVTIEETELGGMMVPPGEAILILLGAANRDPEMFADPDRLDLGRHNATRHLSFGGGIHHCLGMALARTEGHIVLGGLVARFPNLALVDEPEIGDRFVLRGYPRIMVDSGR